MAYGVIKIDQRSTVHKIGHRLVVGVCTCNGKVSYSKKSFTVLVPGPSHALPPGWFVVDPGTGNDVSGSSGLLGNVPVNGLDEWDLNKLGWFKFRQSAQDHDGGGADQGLML